MNWWVRARLRTKIFIAFSSLIIAVLLATLGFTQVGRLTAVGHKHGRWIDTVLMQRSLDGSSGHVADRPYL